MNEYKADNIGIRLNPANKQFCVIIKQGGSWKQAGDWLRFPLPALPTLAKAKSSSDVAILMLQIENPKAAKEFAESVYPR